MINASYTAKYDGKDVQVTGNAQYGTIAMKQVNANTLTDERKKTTGPYKATGHTVVSNGGKTMTTTTKRTNADGKMARSSLRFLFSINSRVVFRFRQSDTAVRWSALKAAVFQVVLQIVGTKRVEPELFLLKPAVHAAPSHVTSAESASPLAFATHPLHQVPSRGGVVWGPSTVRLENVIKVGIPTSLPACHHLVLGP